MKTKSWEVRLASVATKGPSYLVLGLWSLFTIFVIAWIFLSSLKTNGEVFRNVFGMPKEFQWGNYVKAFLSGNFGLYLFNSVLITVVSVVVLLAVSAPAAYVLSRREFRGRGFLTGAFVAGIGIPYIIVLIPLYSLVSVLGLRDSYLGIIAIYVALSVPFSVYMLTGFLSTLPVTLEEAGTMDGCSEFQVFTRIMLPLSSPGIVTAAIFNGIGLWNEYQLIMTFAGKPEMYTLSRGLYALQNAMQYTGDWTGLFAGITIVMVPTIVLFVLMSKRIISGITAGAVKG
jgi:ABC-type glycerol-3-phosphate transport system permease component